MVKVAKQREEQTIFTLRVPPRKTQRIILRGEEEEESHEGEPPRGPQPTTNATTAWTTTRTARLITTGDRAEVAAPATKTTKTITTSATDISSGIEFNSKISKTTLTTAPHFNEEGKAVENPMTA